MFSRLIQECRLVVEGGGSRLSKPARQAAHLSNYSKTPWRSGTSGSAGSSADAKYWQRMHARDDGQDPLKMRQHLAKHGFLGRKVKYPAKY